MYLILFTKMFSLKAYLKFLILIATVSKLYADKGIFFKVKVNIGIDSTINTSKAAILVSNKLRCLKLCIVDDECAAVTFNRLNKECSFYDDQYQNNLITRLDTYLYVRSGK